MRWQVAVGIGVVGVLGGGLAAFVLLSPGLGTAPGPVEGERVSPEPVASTPSPPIAPSRGAPEPPPHQAGPGAGSSEDAPDRIELDALFTAPVRGMADLEPRYERALDARITLDDLPPDALPGDVEKALSDRMLQATATVNAAADAHLQFAEAAPREQATRARGRAADLYQHLADTLRDAPVPDHFPADQAAVQRTMHERMAESYTRRAAALRAGSAPPAR